jgi:hypothetical protein
MTVATIILPKCCAVCLFDLAPVFLITKYPSDTGVLIEVYIYSLDEGIPRFPGT